MTSTTPTLPQVSRAPEQFAREGGRVLGFSAYAASVIAREGHWLAERWSQGQFGLPESDLESQIEAELADADSPGGIMAAARRVRHRRLLEILWQDLNGNWELPETLRALSLLAEVLIQALLSRAHAAVTRRFGQPIGADSGTPQQLVVLGMGKLGGRELNFSSDIDLIYCYPEAGSTDGRRAVSNEEFFARVGRLLAQWLAERTENGFVYRVDLRLRPFGDAGRVALSFAAMEQYYQRDGRDWERYALIKARPVAGDIPAGYQLLKLLRPFVYRRYLDFAAFDALREMKQKIRDEVTRVDMADNVKLGPGGIREIEFVVQAFQLVRGGRQPELRSNSLNETLARLGDQGLLAPARVEALARAYVFLRRLENRLQQIADQQTHSFPDDALTRELMARAMDVDRAESLVGLLASHRREVSAAFEEVFAEATVADAGESGWVRLWRLDESVSMADALAEAGFAEPGAAAEKLARFRQGATYRMLGNRARARVDDLVPALLGVLESRDEPDVALDRVLPIIANLAARSTYVALLCQQPLVLKELVNLASRSPWIAETIRNQPILLDELIDPDSYQPGPGRFKTLLRRRLERLDDPEEALIRLRQVQQAEQLTMAIARIKGLAEAPQVAAELTGLADAILGEVLAMSYRDLAARHGEPSGDNPGMAVIGYGTLGGSELGFQSDLDLVFLFDGATVSGSTSGDRCIGNQQFFTRVAQRVLSGITAPLAGGRLYEVDTRLRPDGNSGFLVSSVDAYAAYQRDKAWTWELQALTRARWVAGSDRIRRRFEAVRRETLLRERAETDVARDVLEMRRKMRGHLDRGNPEMFDLKQGVGGKVDIEFLAQYAVLAWGHRCPQLADCMGTVAVLDQVCQLELSPPYLELPGIYREYQRQGQILALLGLDTLMPEPALTEHREAVRASWEKVLEAVVSSG